MSEHISAGGSLRQDLADIWKAAGFVALALTFLTLGVSGVLAAITAPAVDISIVVFGTWPFVLSLTVFFLLCVRGTFLELNPLQSLMTVFFLFLIPYGIAIAVGVAKWHGQTYVNDDYGAAAAVKYAFHEIYYVISYYYRTYGPSLTAQALACSIFLAWAIQFKILPHAERVLNTQAKTPGHDQA